MKVAKMKCPELVERQLSTRFSRPSQSNFNMIIDLLLKITTPIICKDGRKTIGTGTGFFFRHNQKTYLITNRHIFINERENFYPDKISIKLNKAEDDPTKSGDLIIDLYKKEIDEKKWIEIDKDIDLAALEFEDPVGYILAALSKENLPPESFRMGLGEQLLVIGYPRNFYDEIHNLPIMRGASIASAYGIPFRKYPLFLIDSRLHPGTSGSPVITIPKSIFQDPKGGIAIGSKPQWHFLGVNSGEFGELQLNAIWYSYLIPKMLEKDSKK